MSIRDIKPANVLVDSATGQVWPTGFGIASRLPRERQSPDPLEFLAGTPNGRLIVDLVPELKLIIGDQPPVPELPPKESDLPTCGQE